MLPMTKILKFTFDDNDDDDEFNDDDYSGEIKSDEHKQKRRLSQLIDDVPQRQPKTKNNDEKRNYKPTKEELEENERIILEARAKIAETEEQETEKLRLRKASEPLNVVLNFVRFITNPPIKLYGTRQKGMLIINTLSTQRFDNAHGYYDKRKDATFYKFGIDKNELSLNERQKGWEHFKRKVRR